MVGLQLAQQHARADALEAAQAEVAQLAAVEACFEDAGPAGEAHAVEELGAVLHFEEQLALFRVPLQRNEALEAPRLVLCAG